MDCGFVEDTFSAFIRSEQPPSPRHVPICTWFQTDEALDLEDRMPTLIEGDSDVLSAFDTPVGLEEKDRMLSINSGNTDFPELYVPRWMSKKILNQQLRRSSRECPNGFVLHRRSNRRQRADLVEAAGDFITATWWYHMNDEESNCCSTLLAPPRAGLTEKLIIDAECPSMKSLELDVETGDFQQNIVRSNETSRITLLVATFGEELQAATCTRVSAVCAVNREPQTAPQSKAIPVVVAAVATASIEAESSRIKLWVAVSMEL